MSHLRPAALAAALATLCIAAPAARAQYAQPFSHQSLFFRAEGGLSYINGSADFAGSTAVASGGAGYLGFGFGGAIASDVVLFGEVWGMSAPSPKVQYGDLLGTANGYTLNYSGIGLGVAWFTPSNVHFDLTFDFTRLGVTNSRGDATNSDIGLALTASLGKQFWLSPSVGLGFSGKGILGGNRDNNNDPNSATYRVFSLVAVIALTFG